MNKTIGLDSHLILYKTHRDLIKKGIPIFVSGKGTRITDNKGNTYLDFVSGVTRPVHIGHGREEMARAIYEQICKLEYFTPMHYATEPSIELADLLSNLLPRGIKYFTFVCDGSEAVETAFKLAKHYHVSKAERMRYKILARKDAYHGVTGMTLPILGMLLPMRHVMEPLQRITTFVEHPNCYRCPVHLKYPECDLFCARDIERTINFEGPETISAFLGETIQHGVYPPPKEYWPIVQDICKKYDIVLIADEVVNGFGRTGKWFGYEHFDLNPDIIVLAKGITSGYVPLGAVGCTKKIIENVEEFNDLHTYGNHPVSCAAALKNIEIIQREDLISNSRIMGEYLLKGLKTFKNYPNVGEIRGAGGLWAAIDFKADNEKGMFPIERLLSMIKKAKSKGLIINLMGSAFEFAPPLIITEKEIDEAIEILDEILTQ